MLQPPTLAIVIPCYNEEECIVMTTNRLLYILSELERDNIISNKSFIFFVDDGSNDKTGSIIEKYTAQTNSVRGIKLSKNFGNQKAILAGLLEASKYEADCFITMDADLQQDETKIREFIEKYNNGAKIVFGIRNDRRTDGFFKKLTALSFYKIIRILGVDLKVNHSDFRLISREIINVLKQFPEKNIFLRGIFNDLGFKRDYVYFDVKERFAGKTKYSSFSLFSLALSGITSFSIVPLRFVTLIGFIIAFISFIGCIWTFIAKLTGTYMVSGWATIIVFLGFIGGMQILCLGIIGEYIGQLFREAKARPRYIIEKEY